MCHKKNAKATLRHRKRSRAYSRWVFRTVRLHQGGDVFRSADSAESPTCGFGLCPRWQCRKKNSVSRHTFRDCPTFEGGFSDSHRSANLGWHETLEHHANHRSAICLLPPLSKKCEISSSTARRAEQDPSQGHGLRFCLSGNLLGTCTGPASRASLHTACHTEFANQRSDTIVFDHGRFSTPVRMVRVCGVK